MNLIKIFKLIRATSVTVAESEKDMLQLTEIFDLLGRKEFVIITEKENKLYYGECGKCPIDIWRNAHIKEMKFNNKNARIGQIQSHRGIL